VLKFDDIAVTETRTSDGSVTLEAGILLRARCVAGPEELRFAPDAARAYAAEAARREVWQTVYGGLRRPVLDALRLAEGMDESFSLFPRDPRPAELVRVLELLRGLLSPELPPAPDAGGPTTPEDFL
jgi:hypothetical protein